MKWPRLRLPIHIVDPLNELEFVTSNPNGYPKCLKLIPVFIVDHCHPKRCKRILVLTIGNGLVWN